MYDENNDLILLRSKINKDTNPYLYKASEMLCLSSFKQFQDRMEKAKLYSKQMTTPTNATIRSLMHPTAPCRQCYRENINEYFTGLTCESSIAREEQCVHSINANDFVFIPEQFASYHFRRKLVSGSYISMDPNESGSDMNHNDTNSDDESVETENDSVGLKTADNDHSIDQQQGAFFEQLPGQSKAVKCLSSSELKNVMDQILGNYSMCSNQVKKTINAIMLSLNEMSITDGQSNGILHEDEDNDSNENMLMSINNLISEHCNSFLSSKNNFMVDISTNSDYLKRSKNHFRKHKKNRIMSTRHKAAKKAKRYHEISLFESSAFQTNHKKVIACKFCGSTEIGERLSSCKKRAHLQSISVEYILGKYQNGLNNFIHKMEHNTEFDSNNTLPETYITIGENSKSSHFFIHRVWHRPNTYPSMYHSIESLIFEYSYINKMGEIEPKKSFIAGKALHSMLVACNLKKGPFFIFDKTSLKNDNAEFRGGSTYHNPSQNMFSQSTNMSMSQSSFDFSNNFTTNTFSQNSTLNPMRMNNVNFENNTMYSYLSQHRNVCVEVDQEMDQADINNQYRYATM